MNPAIQKLIQDYRQNGDANMIFEQVGAEKTLLRVEIRGDETYVRKIQKFLDAVTKLCSYGASRSVEIFIDGDGPENITVKDLSTDKPIESDLPKGFDEADPIKITE